jgi:hypothetical protein
MQQRVSTQGLLAELLLDIHHAVFELCRVLQMGRRYNIVL